MTSVLSPVRSVGILWGAVRLPTVMQAAVASVRADDAPAVTMAASHLSLRARYSPAAVWSSASRTGCCAARATAPVTEGGMVDAVSAVYVPAALMILATP